MKFRTFRQTLAKCFGAICIALLAGSMVSCSDDNGELQQTFTADPFNPSKPVQVTGFTPESGGYQEQIIVKGSNFGNDKNMVTLTIGGKKAVVVNVLGDRLYAYVPSGAFSGQVAVTVLYNDKEYTAVCDKIFNYERKKVVGTLCGYRNEEDNQGEIFGPFATCTGFRNEGCLAFDPLYPNRLYVIYDRDGGGFVGELDLEKREYTRIISGSKFGNQRMRNMAFTLDGKYMLCSTDRNDNSTKSVSVWILTRNADGTFSDRSPIAQLAAYRQCNGVAVHPVNGEVYFNSYENGQLFRLDLEDYFNPKEDEDGEVESWTGYLEDGCFRELFRIMDPSYEFNITIHPSGDYAYINLINRHYILRTDYDWEKKEFTTPYTVAGFNGSAGWEDAVGTSSRVNRPYQGVFVKNPEYEAEGRSDIYDYYFADCTNFCIRYITPDGLVRTFAGRSPSTNGNIWGTEDGDLRNAARFRDVTGLAYDEANDMFYVLDHNNRNIRTIGMESEATETEPAPGEGDDQPEQTTAAK